jgi:hypothetical protein
MALKDVEIGKTLKVGMESSGLWGCRDSSTGIIVMSWWARRESNSCMYLLDT